MVEDAVTEHALLLAVTVYVVLDDGLAVTLDTFVALRPLEGDQL